MLIVISKNLVLSNHGFVTRYIYAYTICQIPEKILSYHTIQNTWNIESPKTITAQKNEVFH